MSAFDRINNIENRISQLEARLEGSSAMSRPASTPSNLKMNTGAGHPGVSFEHLLHSMSEDKRFRPTGGAGAASSWKGDPKDFDGMISEAAKKHNVEESLVRAVIKQESGFNPKATSGCGAQGLMQLMPDTARELGCSNGYDPYQNIMAGSKYLRQLLDRFDGNMTKAIAGYNAGPGAVEQYGGMPPYAETQNYVSRVLENFRNYKGMGT